MAKKDLIAELETYGITDHSGTEDITPLTGDETVAELEEMLTKLRPVTNSTKKTSVTVTWNNGVREYSKEVHGDDFMDLAKQFAEKFNGTIA